MAIKLGVIGVGDLTEKMLRGLYRAGHELQVHLSPRNKERGEKLALELGCVPQQSNQAVVDASDVLLIGVRPAQLNELAQQVQLRPEQALVSVVIGVPVAELQTLFGIADCSRAMLSGAAEINRSSVAVYPSGSMAEQLLAPLGQLIVLDSEREFELATVGACINGWSYFLLQELQQWMQHKGLPTERARALVLSAFEDSVAYARHRSDVSAGDIGRSIALPHTFTAQGLAVLQQHGAPAAWVDACEQVFEGLLQAKR